LENREKIITKRLSRTLQGDWDALRLNNEWQSPFIPEEFMPLDPVKIEKIIVAFKKGCINQKPFVIIDTLRSAFGEDEMDVKEMRKLLYPLQRVAQRQQAAILILHHRPKSGAAYSGQTAIAGACDYFWTWDVEKEKCQGTLKLYGTRGDPQSPLVFQYDKTTGREIWVPHPEDSNNQLDGIVRGILANKPIINKTELGRLIRNQWRGDLGRDKVGTLIDGLVGELLTTTTGEHNQTLYSLIGGGV
jgi:hypothetical protein